MDNSIAINGMGRIGRMLLRAIFSADEPRLNVKAVNCSYPPETIAHLLKYDTVHGRWDADISAGERHLTIGGHRIEVTAEREPHKLPWGELGVDIAIDATGKFTDREGASRHLQAGARSVIVTAPGKGLDMTVVMGVNDSRYDASKHRLLSAASCTTNCVAPVLSILDQHFGVAGGWVTTVHSFTSDQRNLDNPHKDLRRARACGQSIIPTTTGIGKALKDVLPHLAPAVHGLSLRVPTPNVSVVDFTLELARPTAAEEVQSLFREAANSRMAAYVGYCDEPLVSSDYIGASQSAVIDGLSIMTAGRQLKLLAWYDNEWGYACRVADLAALVASGLDCGDALTRQISTG